MTSSAGESGCTLRKLAGIPVGEIHRVGERRAEALAALDITSVLDLVMHYPRRYVDRTRHAEVAELAPGDEATVLATVRSSRTRRTRQGRVVVELGVDDGTARMQVTFFNQAWRAKQLTEGVEALFFGKLEIRSGRRTLTNPVVDLIGNRTGRIVPIYPTSEKAGIGGWEFGEWVEEALRRAGTFADPLPESIRDRLGLLDRTGALNAVHVPGDFEVLEAAKRRLAFDELLRLQVQVVRRRLELERDARGLRHRQAHAGDLVSQFLARLAFPLTGAQRRAIGVMRGDMESALPMHRLLQGDVGSGKTVVALCALLTAVDGGHQGALMAPTEVLAEQHHLGVRQLLEQMVVPDPSRLGGSRPLAVALLTNRTPAAARRLLRDELAAGALDIVVGTHALLTEDVRFSSLGVAVIDEQHRFGVEQRAALAAKGRDGTAGFGADPDLLVMTATPIPRTAAMVIFGDLDVTELDEMPPGRIPIRTRWVRDETRHATVWQRVRDEVARHRRAFVVCPLVEGSERVQAASATAERDRLAAGALSGLGVGLLHGQMKSADKEDVMASFRRGDLDVLVATTVVEVGVDVPEATVMVIEDAQRFGIAQLHQLRGRVGRGRDESYCFLLGAADSPEAERRLRAVEQSTDGFELADVDLELRGEGTILGARQKGRSDLKLASLRRVDRPLVLMAREVAEEIVGDDPLLGGAPLLADELDLLLGEEAEVLAKS
ncbi:MAG: ATP-dependent DNA helicase RecG [Acidimicrobiales bacterium]